MDDDHDPTVIGNGFDLTYESKTRFSDYISSDSTRYIPRYERLKNKDDNWNAIENRFSENIQSSVDSTPRLHVSEFLEQTIPDCEFNNTAWHIAISFKS